MAKVRSIMRARFTFAFLLAAVLVLLCVPLAAHHGTGVSYDASKPIVMKATVTEFRYANPHPQLFFDVIDDKGNVTHWSGELAPNPAQLVQAGWGKKRSEAVLAPGTKITVTIGPARVGGPVGLVMKMVSEKGETLLGLGAGEGAPPAAPAAP
jgi:hypothetical protein